MGKTPGDRHERCRARGPQFVHGYLLRPAYDLLLALPYTLFSMERGSDCCTPIWLAEAGTFALCMRDIQKR
jgi:hypothetical protein